MGPGECNSFTLTPLACLLVTPCVPTILTPAVLAFLLLYNLWFEHHSVNSPINQVYTVTITAGSCYREVRWNWKVSTNGQNPTFSHLSARSQLRKWQWPSSSCCVAGHRQGHPEKDPHFSKELAHGCWKLNNTLSPSLGLFTRESSLCD